jgi:hypothetical protein
MALQWRTQRQPEVLRLAALAQDDNFDFGLIVISKSKGSHGAASASMLG